MLSVRNLEELRLVIMLIDNEWEAWSYSYTITKNSVRLTESHGKATTISEERRLFMAIALCVDTYIHTYIYIHIHIYIYIYID